MARRNSWYMRAHLSPFVVLLRLIGGPAIVADACGISDKAPYKWRIPSKVHDADDVPSARHMRRLLRYSDARGLGLKPEHLIYGADADEIDAILAAREAFGADTDEIDVILAAREASGQVAAE